MKIYSVINLRLMEGLLVGKVLLPFWLIFFFVNLLLLSFFSVIIVYVAVLAHPSSVEFAVGAVPRLLGPSILVIAVVAHPLGIMGLILVATFVHFLSKFSI